MELLGAQDLTNGALWLSSENGYLENLQVLLIAIALVTCVWTAIVHTGAERTVPWVLAAACCVCLIREMDFRTFDGPAWFAALTTAEVVKIWYAVLVAVTTLYLIKRRKDILIIVPVLFDFWWWPLYLSAMFISVGQILDQWPGMIPLERTVEEMSELLAYALLLFAAIRICRDGMPDGLGAHCPAGPSGDVSLK